MDFKLNCLLVGAFWGVTNPFIKRGLLGMDKINKNDPINQLIADTCFLISNWKVCLMDGPTIIYILLQYLIPFLIANCGSVIYYFTLQKTDLTVAVPFTNSFAFIFTAVTGCLLGEQKPNVATVAGMILILIGNYCYDMYSPTVLQSNEL